MTTQKVTKETILKGTPLVIREPNEATHRYKLDLSKGTARYAAALFVKIQDAEGIFQYSGMVDSASGTLRTTRNSRAGIETTHAFKLLDRVLQRIWANDHHAFESMGYTVEAGETASVPEARSAIAGALDFITDSFVLALGYGLKRPMIRVHYRDQRFKFYLSKRGTVCMKSGKLAPKACDCGADRTGPSAEAHAANCEARTYSNDPTGDEEYIGCLVFGKFLPAKVNTGYGYGYDYAGDGQAPSARREERPLRPMTETEKEFMEKLGADPVGFLAACSKDMCRCCYCYLPLEDQRSKAVGYGSICAKRWGLPWGKEVHGEKVPGFASRYTSEVHALFVTLRQNPEDNTVWEILSDYIQEKCYLPRLKKPESGVVLPRNDS